MNTAQYALTHHVDFSLGVCIEAGVAGGSSLREIVAAVPSGHPVFGFDWFKGLPEDWLPHFPKGSFDRDGVVPDVPGAQIIVGLVEDTLPIWTREHPDNIAFLHIDIDLYAPCKAILACLDDRIPPGAVIVFDEFREYEGCEQYEQRALREWCSERGRLVTELPVQDDSACARYRAAFRVLK